MNKKILILRITSMVTGNTIPEWFQRWTEISLHHEETKFINFCLDLLYCIFWLFGSTSPVCTGYYEHPSVRSITSTTAEINTIRNSFPLTHSWSWILLDKSPTVQRLKGFPAFHGTRRFITVLTRALHWFLSWDRSMHFPSLRSFIQRIRLGPRFLMIFRNKLIFLW
jgi:hypothetical protein